MGTGIAISHEGYSLDFVFAIYAMRHLGPHQWNETARGMCSVVKPVGRVVIFEHNPIILSPGWPSIVADSTRVQYCFPGEHAPGFCSRQPCTLQSRNVFFSSPFSMHLPLHGAEHFMASFGGSVLCSRPKVRANLSRGLPGIGGCGLAVGRSANDAATTSQRSQSTRLSALYPWVNGSLRTHWRLPLDCRRESG